MIVKLLKLADQLDSKGFYQEASIIDQIVFADHPVSEDGQFGRNIANIVEHEKQDRHGDLTANEIERVLTDSRIFQNRQRFHNFPLGLLSQKLVGHNKEEMERIATNIHRWFFGRLNRRFPR